MRFKAKAKKYHQAVSEYDTVVIKEMLCENYIQHNPKVASGRQAFLDLIPSLKYFGAKIENYRIIEDGSYVIMHHRWHNATPMGAKDLVAFHIIRFNDQGLIAEHWNVAAPVVESEFSKKIDGPREVVRSKLNTQFKSQTKKLVKEWTKRELSTSELNEYFLKNFKQHNPDIADGTLSLNTYRKAHIEYKHLHAIFGEGQFVLSITEGNLNDSPTAFYDLFRFEDDLIAEHWNVYQAIPKSGLANTNTMFGF